MTTTWNNSWQNSWTNPWGQPGGGLMSPITPWGLGAFGALPPAQTSLGSLVGQPGAEDGEDGKEPGSSTQTGGFTGTNAAKSSAIGRTLGGYALGQLGSTATLGAASTAMGFTPSIGDLAGHAVRGLANPASALGLTGRVAAQQMGFTGPKPGIARNVMGAVNPVLGGILGTINPALGLAYGLMSPFGVDFAADAINAREDEKHRDALESAHGTFGGRTAARDFDAMAAVGGFGTLGKMAEDYGYGPNDLARGLSNRDASKAMGGRNPSGSSYGGFGAVGGPVGGARAVDPGYGRNMEGYAGLGIGNPSSYGGGNSSGGGGGRDKGGGYGGHAGDQDGSSTGYGR